VTVSDRLRVRSRPEVDAASVKYEPVLPVGTQLQVIDGPVEGSGYQWVRVAPVDVTLDGGVADGWVAVADHDGTPWVSVSAAPLTGLNVAEASVKLVSPSVADARRAASEVNSFGIRLYRRLLADPNAKLTGKGVAMSPTSIALAVAMARAGAGSLTAAQIDDVLRANGWSDLGSGLGSLQQILNDHNATWKDDEGTSHSLSLNVVNRAFGQDGWPIEQAYLQRIGRAFGAGIGLVDYIRDSSAARDLINGWVARQTANRIPKLLAPTDVTASTRLVLVNAIYLKANWQHEFSEDGTRKRPFTTHDGTVRVPTMSLLGEQDVSLATGAGWQATELRYAGAGGSSPLAMTLIRPDNLAAFERSLSPALLAEVQTKVRAEAKRQAKITPADDGDMHCPQYAYNVRLFLPKFGIDTNAQLGPVLAAMGMPNAFDPERADFSGITTSDRLFIAKVIHQANIDVDEKGTVAAAATAVIGDTTGGCGPAAPLKTKTLRFDKPFVYLIRDVRTGAILFMGRVLDPSKR
jgi:serpin B